MIMELVKLNESEFEKVVTESGLAIKEGEEIKQSYLPYLNELAEIQAQSSKINFDKPTLLDEKIASELRKKTVKVRTGASELKDSRKRIHLLKGNLEQAAYNLIAATCKLTEETFSGVEKAREIAEKNRIAQLETDRKCKLSQFTDIVPVGLGTMQEDVFTAYLSGQELAFNKKIEVEKQAEAERIEKERIQKLHEVRKDAILTFWKYVAPEHRYDNLGELTEEEWDNLGKTLDDRKKAEDAENERIRLENERLQKETERKEAELKAQREKADEEKKKAEQRIKTGNARKDILFEIGINLDFQSCADMPEDSWKEFFELKNKEYQAEQNRIALEKMKAERDAKKEREKQAEELRIQKEKQAEAERQLQVQKEAEERRIQREKQRLIDEESEKAKAAKAPDKEKLTKWIESLNIATPELTDLSAVIIATDISDKFEAFKNWANKQIEKL